MPYSLDILLDMMVVDMAVDTLMEVASLAFEIAYIQLDMMVAYMALDTSKAWKPWKLDNP